MKEGPIKESSYFFPGEQIMDYIKELPALGSVEDQYLSHINEKVVVMTHDDVFCDEMFEEEKSMKFESTWFLFSTALDRKFPAGADIHLHFNKEAGILEGQIKAYCKRFGKNPMFNRNHRLLWRSNNFDFPFLAMNGIAVDTTLIGTRPYRPSINGRIIPIWELPFCITDRAERFFASYNVAKDFESPFKDGLSPIVVLAHPFKVCKEYGLMSCFYEVLRLTQEYGYTMMSVNAFYNKFLKE